MECQTSPVAISKKLSSPKTIYDGVFSAAAAAAAAPPSHANSRFDEYKEIFRGSKNSASIPFLDVPELNRGKPSVDVKSSGLDYSNIFGGFGGFDGALSYEELGAKPKKKRDKSLSFSGRTSAVKSSPLEVSDNPDCQGDNYFELDKESYQSVVSTKQSTMYCCKGTKGGRKMTHGTTDVAHLHAVPVHTSVVDKKSPPKTTKYDKPLLSEDTREVARKHAVPAHPSVDKKSPPKTAKHNKPLPSEDTREVVQQHAVPSYTSVDKKSVKQATENGNPLPSEGNDDSNINDSCKRMDGGNSCKQAVSDSQDGVAKKQVPEVAVKLENKCSWSESSSRVKPNLSDVKGDFQSSKTSKAGQPQSSDVKISAGSFCFSPPGFDEEMDVNSVAAASAAAVKVAIEKAQARINMAKESRGKKKVGLRGSVKTSSRVGIRLEETNDVNASSLRCEIKAREASETVDTQNQNLAGVVKQNLVEPCQVASGFSISKKQTDTEGSQREVDTQSIRTMPVDQSCQRAEEWEAEIKFCEPLRENLGHIHDSDQKLQSSNNSDLRETTTNEENFERSVDCSELLEEAEKSCTQEKSRGEQISHSRGEDQQRHVNRLNSAEEFGDQEGSEPIVGVAQEHQEIEKKLHVSEQVSHSRGEDQQHHVNRLNSAEEFGDQEGSKPMVGVAQEHQEIEKKLHASEEEECCREELKHFEPPQEETKVELQELEEIKVRDSPKATEQIEAEEQEASSSETKENNHQFYNDGQSKENDVGLKETCGQESMESTIISASKKVEYQNKPEEVSLDDKLAGNHPIGAQWENDSVKKLSEVYNEETGGTLGGLHGGEQCEQTVTENEKIEVSHDHEEFKDGQSPQQVCQLKENRSFAEACEWTEADSVQTGTEIKVDDEKIETTKAASSCQENGAEYHDLWKQGHDDNPSEVLETCMPEENTDFVNVVLPEVSAQEESGSNSDDWSEASFETRVCKKDSEAVEQVKQMEESQTGEEGGFGFSAAAVNNFKEQMEGATEINFAQRSHEQPVEDPVACNMGFESGRSSDTEKEAEVSAYRDEGNSSGEEKYHVDRENKETTQMPNMSKLNRETMETCEEAERSEAKEESHHTTLKEKVGEFQRERKFERERPKGKDVAKEIEREKEKQRIAVERAMREARERAFAEARRKVMAETREQSEKTPIETNERSAAEKASMEAKIKAERAAVERATAEARERALRKAVSEKESLKSRSQADKFSGIPKDNETRRAFSFNDSENKRDFVGPPSDLRRPDSINHGVPSSSERSEGINTGSMQRFKAVFERSEGINTGSMQRFKAVFERHQRTAERAAKALAEKNKRDLLAQKEQQERNRLAGSLDADIKMWSTGKEKNLRALLSTLQYILGPDSGWQPISLTDLVTTAAVKKAYRKATLCVHPDKLQQRGASIQQKYICEKVFDLLKDAWNRFSSEER